MRVNITRFAPAPTGFLHLGHLVNALYVWGAARQYDARVLLRIEDHDRQRSRREFEAAIFEDLDWLGFRADEPAVRQSGREYIYRQALETLKRHDLVYACACSRAEIQSDFYPGTCRDRGLADAPGLGLRVRLAPTIERFVDLRHGLQEQQPSAQCGDLLIRDRDGNWTYQFCAAVDDYVQGVTLVVRGDDLLASTGRQIQLARLLGRTDAPQFLHHPLIFKSATQKLSKSDGDTGIRDLRAKGWTAAQLIEKARALVGDFPLSWRP
jgi:Glutamyl- and glutaminyl-tRNA synthetases